MLSQANIFQSKVLKTLHICLNVMTSGASHRAINLIGVVA